MNSPCTRSVTTCKKSSGLLYVHITAGSALAVLVSIGLHSEDSPWRQNFETSTVNLTPPLIQNSETSTVNLTHPLIQNSETSIVNLTPPLIQNSETSNVNHFRSLVDYFGEQNVSELEAIQWQFKSLCHRHCFKHWPHNFASVLDYVNFRTSRVRRCNLNVPFHVDVYDAL
jgi:hypothetical protein